MQSNAKHMSASEVTPQQTIPNRSLILKSWKDTAAGSLAAMDCCKVQLSFVQYLGPRKDIEFPGDIVALGRNGPSAAWHRGSMAGDAPGKIGR